MELGHNDNVKQVARRLQGLREMSQTSVQTMAKVTGLSASEYLEHESGNRDLTVSFLFNCANHLGVDVGEILTGTAPRLRTYTVCRSGSGLPIKRREGLRYFHLAAPLKDRLAEPCLVRADYSREAENAPVRLTTHSGQELDYVLKGTLRVVIDGHSEILRAGDSVYFDASKPHGAVAVNGEDCEFLAVGMKGGTGEYEQPVPSGHQEIRLNTREDLLYQQYVEETLDSEGHLTDISFRIPETFNFGYDVVDALAEKNPGKLAMVWESNSGEVRHFSFGDMARYSSMTAHYLKELGIGKGDKVMLILKRHYQFWFAITALHKLGAIVIPATDQLTKKDLVYRFNEAGVKAVICTGAGKVAEAVEQALPESPTVTVKMMANGTRDGWLDYDQGIAGQPAHFPRPTGDGGSVKTDTMLMYFTSGTTGYPKIVSHDHTYPVGHVVTARWWHNVNPDGLHFTISDTGWAKSMWGKIYGQWLCEAAIYTYDFDRFQAGDILRKFAQHHITTFCAPPTMYRMFIKEDLGNYDLSSLEYSCTAGEALNPEVYNKWLEYTGLKTMEGFGQTETTLILANLTGANPRPGSMGKPNPQYRVEIIDQEDKPVSAGEVGEIVISTKDGAPCGLFDGYYNDEQQTKSSWHDGYYHTGDTAWCDEEGFYWYVSRTDDIIKSSGYRIGPFEIESVIMELPYVLECAITGVPDDLRGQIVKATIVLTKGTEGSEELGKEIQNYVKERTAPYKYPRIVEFVDELPKTISGKIRRVQIREGDQA